jgi:hypothetical protein
MARRVFAFAVLFCLLASTAGALAASRKIEITQINPQGEVQTAILDKGNFIRMETDGAGRAKESVLLLRAPLDDRALHNLPVLRSGPGFAQLEIIISSNK